MKTLTLALLDCLFDINGGARLVGNPRSRNAGSDQVGARDDGNPACEHVHLPGGRPTPDPAEVGI
jgi:hypothetical protein